MQQYKTIEHMYRNQLEKDREDSAETQFLNTSAQLKNNLS